MRILSPKALSSLSEPEALQLLTGSRWTTFQKKDFDRAWWDDVLSSEDFSAEVQERHRVKGAKQLFDRLGEELALRCSCEDPQHARKEMSKRELISPLLYVVSFLTGKDLSPTSAGSFILALTPIPAFTQAPLASHFSHLTY